MPDASVVVAFSRNQEDHECASKQQKGKWQNSKHPDDCSLINSFSTSISAAKRSSYLTRIQSSFSNPKKLFSIFYNLLDTPPPDSTLLPSHFVYFTTRLDIIYTILIYKSSLWLNFNPLHFHPIHFPLNYHLGNSRPPNYGTSYPMTSWQQKVYTSKNTPHLTHRPYLDNVAL